MAKTTDSLNTTILTPDNTKLIGGMYYYICSDYEMDKISAITGNCSAVNSCWFSPILTEEDLTTKEVEYDVKRYGELKGWELNFTPTLKRITKVNTIKKKIGEIDKYPVPNRTKKKHWSNESRLYNFPYTYYLLTDFINPPLEIKAHEIKNNEKISVYAKAFITDRGSYSLYVNGLKGDSYGNMEGQVSTATLDIPVGSSAYSQWSATQKARDNQNYTNALFNLSFQGKQTELNNSIGLKNSVASSGGNFLGSLMKGDIVQALGSLASAGVNAFNQYQVNNLGLDKLRIDQNAVIGLKSAQLKDLSNTPRTMLSTGSDINFNLINGNRQIALIKYTITDEYKERLTDYFTFYGYKQAKVMNINIRSRYYFNYIKTSNVNIYPEGIPKAHYDELRNIYNSGVTIWHMDNKGVHMFDYSKDNYEV